MNTAHRRSRGEPARKAVAAGLSALICVFSAPFSAAWAADVAAITGVDVGPDQIRVRVTGDAPYNAFTTASPPRLILQVMDAEYQAESHSYSGKGQFLKGVRAGQFERTPRMVARIVMDLNGSAKYAVAKAAGVIAVTLGAETAAAATPAAPAAVDAPADVPSTRPSVPVSAAMAAAGEATTRMSPELNAIAAQTDAAQGGELDEMPASTADDKPARAASGGRLPRDLISRLPRDPITVDFDNTDIRDVIKLLKAKARINIIYGPDVTGNLTLHLVDVPFNEVFRTILLMMGLSTTQVGNSILRVLTPAELTRMNTAAASTTRVIPLNYAKADAVAGVINTVRAAAGRSGSTIAEPKTNSLIVTESLDGMGETERLVQTLDVRPKQVLIETKLVEVGLNNSLNYGIQWDYQGVERSKLGGKQGATTYGTVANPNAAGLTPPLDQNSSVLPGVGGTGRGTGVFLPATASFGALTFGRITNNYFLSATLTAAATQGKVKVLSDPKVATLNNQPANINVTTSIPFVTNNVSATGAQTQTVNYSVVGIQLTVTPSINADGRIMLLINPSVSQPSATVAAAANGAPAVDTRTTNTTVLVKDGETIVIGGLIADSVSNTIAKVPILGDIPILGWLFKKKSITRSRSELLIFVTSKILQD